jgi:diguanylate cyclase (GGDEF)-like protein
VSDIVQAFLDDEDARHLARQALNDLDRRSVIGAIVYPALWVAITVGTGVAAAWTVPTVVTTLVFVVVATARFVLHWIVTTVPDYHLTRCTFAFRALVLAAVLEFSLLATASLVAPPLEPARDALVLTAGVMCAAATLTLAIDRCLRWGVPAALLGPSAVTLLARPTPEDVTVAFMIIVYFAYVVTASGNVQADYWAASRSALLLQHRAVELEQLSITDELTQLANRRHFDRRLAEEWHRAARTGNTLSVLLVDIDHFKRVNDTHGHQFGDECLKAIAGALRAGVPRLTDLVARYGGEEFVILLVETSLADAVPVAERVRRTVAATTITSHATSLTVTVSIGVASARPGRRGESRERVLALADQALYQAKARGRDQVVTSGPWPGAGSGTR